MPPAAAHCLLIIAIQTRITLRFIQATHYSLIYCSLFTVICSLIKDVIHAAEAGSLFIKASNEASVSSAICRHFQRPESIHAGLWPSGAHYSLNPTFALKLQLAGHSSYYEETDLDFPGNAVILIFSSLFNTGRCSAIDTDFSEDTNAGASPDISLMISWKSRLEY